jgi:hypothetical protein
MPDLPATSIEPGANSFFLGLTPKRPMHDNCEIEQIIWLSALI